MHGPVFVDQPSSRRDASLNGTVTCELKMGGAKTMTTAGLEPATFWCRRRSKPNALPLRQVAMYRGVSVRIWPGPLAVMGYFTNNEGEREKQCLCIRNTEAATSERVGMRMYLCGHLQVTLAQA